jgi:hypothetical protein
MPTKRVYISGPITGRTDGNQSAFYSAADWLIQNGSRPVNPHDVCFLLPPGSTWTEYMKKNIPALCSSDSIYMLRGWWRSRGARLEWVIAWGLGMKIHYEGRK